LSDRSELNERIEELQSRSYKNVEIIELLDEIK